MKKLLFAIAIILTGLTSQAQKHDMYLNNLAFGLGGTPGMPNTFDDYEAGINFKLEPSYFLTHIRIYVGIAMEVSNFRSRDFQHLPIPDKFDVISVATPSLLVARKLWVGNHLRFFPVIKFGYTFLNYDRNYLDENIREDGFNINAEFYTHFYPGRKLGFGFYGSFANAFINTTVNNLENKNVMTFGSAGFSLIYEFNMF